MNLALKRSVPSYAGASWKKNDDDGERKQYLDDHRTKFCWKFVLVVSDMQYVVVVPLCSALVAAVEICEIS